VLKNGSGALSVRTVMNSELRSVLLYVRADIVQIRHRCEPACKLQSEMTGLMRGIVSTIDDLVSTGTVMWNSLFLLHLIHVFTNQLKNIDEVRKAATSVGIDPFTVDADHTRIVCHLHTVISICQNNLAMLCGGNGPPSRCHGSPRDKRQQCNNQLGCASMRLVSREKGRDRLRAASPEVLTRANSTGSVPKVKRLHLRNCRTGPQRRSSTSSLDSETDTRPGVTQASITVPPLDPYVATKLNEMDRLARRCTSRNLMDTRTVIQKSLSLERLCTTNPG
jgi:hypothetical protein